MAVRLLHVVPALGRGGAERQLVTLVCNTSNAQFAHTVCCIGEAGSFSDEVRAAGHPVVALGIRGEHNWLRAARKIVSLIHSYNPDIIQTWLFDATISTRIANLFSTPAIPMITALQDLIYEPETVKAMNWSPRRVALRRLIDRGSMKWSRSVFVAPSFAWETAAREQLGIPSSQICTIYNSVDRRSFNPQPDDRARLRAELEIPDDAVVFLNVGRLERQKGQIFLLQAFEQLLPRAPQAYLVIVGDGPLRGSLKRYVSESEIVRRVRFPGLRTDIGAFFAMADAFVFPSLFEGLGLALVEAMVIGLPCIASNLPALREVIAEDQTGILVSPSAPGDLAAAMLTLYGSKPLRDTLGTDGSAAAVRRFDVDATIPRWVRLYSDTVSPNISANRPERFQ